MKFYIRGYASTERIDRDNEIIKSDAFRESLQEYLQAGGVLLFNHDRDKIIGKVNNAVVDAKGLFVDAVIFTADIEIQKAIEEKALTSFSVGFIPKEINDDNENRIFEKGDILEISVVSVPANPDATFEIYKTENDEAESLEEDKAMKASEKLEKKDVAIVFKEAESDNIKIFEEGEKNMNTEKESVKEVLNELGIETDVKEVKSEVEKSVDVEVVKEAKAVEKAVNTLATSTQFGTTQRAGVFDGLQDGKLFYAPNWQINMQATTVQIPVLGSATVATGEDGISADSSIGTDKITLSATQYTARYPLSYLLESAGGADLQSAIETNLKKSIARAYDSAAWTSLIATTTEVDFEEITTAGGLYQTLLTNCGEIIANPSNVAVIVDTKGLSFLAGLSEFMTVDKFGVNAVVNTGVVGKIFGMDVYALPVTASATTMVIANKDYIASGQFGDIKYVSIVDATGTTYIIAKALLAFGYSVSGVKALVQSAGN